MSVAVVMDQGPGAVGTACGISVTLVRSSVIAFAVVSATMSTTWVKAERPALSDTVTESPGDAATNGVRTTAGLPAAVAPMTAPSDAGFDETTLNTSPAGAGTGLPAASSTRI